MKPSVGPYRRRETCRACGAANLRMTLSLGPTALANSFLSTPDQFETELVYPLDVYVCAECCLLQLLDVVDPDVLFKEYIYTSGTSSTVAAHNAANARDIVQSRGLTPADLVIEIGSNDGSLLKCFAEYGLRTLGIEPAENIAELARADGIETISRFFDRGLAEELRARYGPARVVVANNVLAHVDEPANFLSGCRTLLPMFEICSSGSSTTRSITSIFAIFR